MIRLLSLALGIGAVAITANLLANAEQVMNAMP